MGSKEIKCLPDPYLIGPVRVPGGREERAEPAWAVRKRQRPADPPATQHQSTDARNRMWV